MIEFYEFSVYITCEQFIRNELTDSPQAVGYLGGEALDVRLDEGCRIEERVGDEGGVAAARSNVRPPGGSRAPRAPSTVRRRDEKPRGHRPRRPFPHP